MSLLHFVLPPGVDDPATPSGGNSYDRRVSRGLTEAGWSVTELVAGGSQELECALQPVPDGGLVLLDGLVACAAPEVVLPAARRVRAVVLVHLPLADETGLAPAAAADLDARERAVLHAAAAVVATSEGAARHLVEHHGLSGARVHVAAPGVDPAPPAEASAGGGRLLCVAAVTPRKAQDVLLEALTRVDGDWSCTLVGALDRAPEFAARVRGAAVPLGDRVRLVGPRVGAELEAAYAAADLFVLPSLAETYGMVVTEALARGVPVLGTRVNGVPEAVGHSPGGGRPGMLVPPGDPDALAGALRRWLGEPELRERLRAAARERRATLRRWDSTVSDLVTVLEGL